MIEVFKRAQQQLNVLIFGIFPDYLYFSFVVISISLSICEYVPPFHKLYRVICSRLVVVHWALVHPSSSQRIHWTTHAASIIDWYPRLLADLHSSSLNSIISHPLTSRQTLSDVCVVRLVTFWLKNIQLKAIVCLASLIFALTKARTTPSVWIQTTVTNNERNISKRSVELSDRTDYSSSRRVTGVRHNFGTTSPKVCWLCLNHVIKSIGPRRLTTDMTRLSIGFGCRRNVLTTSGNFSPEKCSLSFPYSYFYY